LVKKQLEGQKNLITSIRQDQRSILVKEDKKSPYLKQGPFI